MRFELQYFGGEYTRRSGDFGGHSPRIGDPPLRLPEPPEGLRAQPMGWRCPNCGGAHAPSVQTCPVDKRTLGEKLKPRGIRVA